MALHYNSPGSKGSSGGSCPSPANSSFPVLHAALPLDAAIQRCVEAQEDQS